MLKKTIKYTDYNGNEREEDFYFNFSKAEIVKLQYSHGGFENYVKRITNAVDTEALINEFSKFVLDAYGVKSDDGKRFIKNDELREAFSQTEAYVEIFMELATNDEAATNFVNHVGPKLESRQDVVPTK
jgi:hypothetical protein